MLTSRCLLALGLVFGLATVADAAPSVLNRSRHRHRRFIEGTVVAVHHDWRAASSGTITIQRHRPYHRNRSRRAVAAVGANNRRRGRAETFPVNRQTRFERTPGGRTSFSAVRKGETVLIEPGSGRRRVARLVDILQGRPHHARARRAARRAIVHATPRHRSAYRRVARPARTTTPATVKPTPRTTLTGSKQPNHKPAAHPKPPAHKPTHPKHPEHKRPQPKPVHHPRPQPKPPVHKGK